MAYTDDVDVHVASSSITSENLDRLWFYGKGVVAPMLFFFWGGGGGGWVMMESCWAM